MKKSGYIILPALMTLLFAAGQGAFAQKDSAAAPVQTKKAAANEIADDELILDEPAGAIVPEVKKPVPAAAANPTPATAVKPYVKVSADTTPKPAIAPKPLKDTAAAGAAAAPPAPAPQKKAVAAKDTAKAVVDEELILDGGAEDLLGREKTVPAKTAAKKDSTSADSTAATAGIIPDSSATAASSDSTSKQPAVSSAAASVTPLPKQLAAQTKIEKVRSINFGANLKEYRSPKLAMLMSLILPGSGQVYAKSNWIAAGFLALEAAVFGTGYAIIAKSKTQKKKAHAFADSLYDVSKYETYSEDLKNYLRTQGNDEEKANSIFIDSIFFGDTAGEQTFLDNARRKNDAYYDDLQGQGLTFVRGWKDVEPDFDATTGFKGIDSTRFQTLSGEPGYLVSHKGNNDQAFGFSENQSTYIDMINKAQSQARTGRNVYLSLLVNHIASAVIAGIVAKKHNDALLGQESVWRRIEVEQNLVNTGSHTVNGYALGITF
jgi:hypothetical protein